jgi:hypothetical protein
VGIDEADALGFFAGSGALRPRSRAATRSLVLAFAVIACGPPRLGQGGSMVTGSGGSGAQGASISSCAAPRSARPRSSASPEGADGPNLGLSSPLPMLRLISRNRAASRWSTAARDANIEQEEYLRQSGMLRQGSQTARGKMITTQYLLTPNVIFSNPNAGGAALGTAIGGLIGGGNGAIVGGALGSMRIKEAQTTLFLTDAQSGVQVGVSEGSAKVRDFGAGVGLGGWGGGVAASA